MKPEYNQLFRARSHIIGPHSPLRSLRGCKLEQRKEDSNPKKKTSKKIPPRLRSSAIHATPVLRRPFRVCILRSSSEFLGTQRILAFEFTVYINAPLVIEESRLPGSLPCPNFLSKRKCIRWTPIFYNTDYQVSMKWLPAFPLTSIMRHRMTLCRWQRTKKLATTITGNRVGPVTWPQLLGIPDIQYIIYINYTK